MPYALDFVGPLFITPANFWTKVEQLLAMKSQKLKVRALRLKLEMRK